MKKLALAHPPGLAAINRLATLLGWHFTDEFPADADCPYEAIWTLPGSGAEVHYIEDEVAGGACFAFNPAADPEQEALLVQHFTCRTLAQALASADQAGNAAEQIDAAAAIAMLAPETPDNCCCDGLAHLMAAADPQVRRRAISAVAALGWQEFVPQLKGIATNDPVDFVRQRARDTLEAFRRIRGF